MLVMVVTLTNIVVATMIWPAGSEDACNRAAAEIERKAAEKYPHEDFKAWCAVYDSRPQLDDVLIKD